MSASERLYWDAFYTEHAQDVLPEPDPLLLMYTPPVFGGESRRALDIAGGAGHNSLWLAEQGYLVDLMDISRVALHRAKEEMAARDLRSINPFQIDFDDAELEQEAYDLVVVIRYLSRPLITKLRAAVIPGGRIVFEMYNRGFLRAQPGLSASEVVGRSEALSFFADWRILHHAELSNTTQVVAVKPN